MIVDDNWFISDEGMVLTIGWKECFVQKGSAMDDNKHWIITIKWARCWTITIKLFTQYKLLIN